VKLASPQRWFLLACGFELALLGVALVVGWALPQTFAVQVRWQPRDAFIGAVAALPPLMFFAWLLRSQWRPFAEVRGFLETVVRPIFAEWSLLQLAVVSLLAGAGEESLFRAVIQGGLTRALGALPALALASALFGFCHGMTRAYAVIAAMVGVYLGLLWLATGKLLTPVVAHALYDFAALVYFLRVRKPGG
jgi:hypothetical protein